MPPNSAPTLLAVDLAQSVLHRVSQAGHSPSAYSAYGDAPALGVAPLGFNGQRREPGNGHYVLGNGYRAYSPGLRRFCAPDRLSPFDAGGLNGYGYCGGDPINRTDPTGAVASVLLTRVAHALYVVGALTSLSAIPVNEFAPDNKTTQIISWSLFAAGALMVGSGGVIYKLDIALPRTLPSAARQPSFSASTWWQQGHAGQNYPPSPLLGVRGPTPPPSPPPAYNQVVNRPGVPPSPSPSASGMVRTSHAQYRQAVTETPPPSYEQVSGRSVAPPSYAQTIELDSLPGIRRAQRL